MRVTRKQEKMKSAGNNMKSLRIKRNGISFHVHEIDVKIEKKVTEKQEQPHYLIVIKEIGSGEKDCHYCSRRDSAFRITVYPLIS